MEARRSDWFRDAEGHEPAVISARASNGAGEIDIFSEIGFWGVTAAGFKNALKALGDIQSLTVNINSPGGDVFDGIAIYNTLVAFKGTVTVRVQGLAASAASLIAMAGDRVEIGSNAFLMIHNAWTFAFGNRHDIAAVAAVLEKIDGALAATYAARTGKDKAEIVDLLDAETWMDGEEAVAEGFADATFDAAELEAPAAANASLFRNAPAAVAEKIAAAAHASAVRKIDYKSKDFIPLDEALSKTLSSLH